MKLKRDAKFGEQSTCRFKTDKESDKFWPEHLKVSKILTLMGLFWAKYILLKLKKYREVIFHEIEEGYKIWSGMDLWFQDWHKGFDKFWAEHSKVSKIVHFNRLFFSKVHIVWAKKVQRSYLSLNSTGYKLGEESTCFFKIDIRNLTNFDMITGKCKKFVF